MHPKTKTAEIFVASKPINFYVYSTLVVLAALGFGVAYAFLEDRALDGKILRILMPSLVVILVSYFFRFWLARNLRSLRDNILATESEEEALRLVFGGAAWGLSAFAALAVTLYISVRPYL